MGISLKEIASSSFVILAMTVVLVLLRRCQKGRKINTSSLIINAFRPFCHLLQHIRPPSLRGRNDRSNLLPVAVDYKYEPGTTEAISFLFQQLLHLLVHILPVEPQFFIQHLIRGREAERVHSPDASVFTYQSGKGYG
jgi:hypothetical protein